MDADKTLAKFSDEDLSQKWFIQSKGVSDSLHESTEVLLMVYSFNSSQTEIHDELAALVRISGIERRTLYKPTQNFYDEKSPQKRGHWRAVPPHALANRLTRWVLYNFTDSEINADILKDDYLRLFKSCADRNGYVHDSDAARALVESWMVVGAPLHDVSKGGANQLICLGYIAPVFPEAVLSALEKAWNPPVLPLAQTLIFITVTQLPCQLIYEDSLFDRAAY